MLNEMGWRKFIIAAAGVGISAVLCWMGKISGSEFQTILLGLSGLFMAGNTAEHFIGKKE